MATTVALQGRLADITSQPIEEITKVTVKAPVATLGVEITTSQPVPVEVAPDGTFTLNVVDGLGWLYLEGNGWSDSIRFVAAAGMSKFWEAVINALPNSAGLADFLQQLASAAGDAAAAKAAMEAAQAAEAGAKAAVTNELAAQIPGEVAKAIASDSTLSQAALEAVQNASEQAQIAGYIRWRRGTMTGDENLNTFCGQEHQGLWGVTGSTAATKLGLPVPTAGVLTVKWIVGGVSTPYCVQTWEPIRTGMRWHRSNESYGWSKWTNATDDVKSELFFPRAATQGEDISSLTQVGRIGVRSTAIAKTMTGLPVERPGILSGYSTTGVGAAVIRMYQDIDGKLWTQGLDMATSKYLPWVEVGGADAAMSSVPMSAHERRDALVKSRGGTIGTGGKGAVAFRFDHNLRAYEEKILPLLEERGLPASMAHYVEEMKAADDYAGQQVMTWGNAADHFARGTEVWSHSWSHNDAATVEQVRKEVVESRAELERLIPAAKVQGWMQPGLTGTKYMGWGDVYSKPGEGGSTFAGALIDATYGSRDSGGSYQPVGTRAWGVLWIDNSTSSTAVINTINDVARLGLGVVIAMHPNRAGAEVPLSVLVEIYDHVAKLRNEGRIEALTVAGLSVADASHSHRHNIARDLNEWEGTPTTKLSLATGVTAQDYLRGNVLEAVATATGKGEVTVRVSDYHDPTRFDVSRTVAVDGETVIHRPFGLHNSSTHIRTVVTVASGSVTVTDVKIRTM